MAFLTPPFVGDNMGGILAITLDSEPGRELLKAASEHAAGVDKKLIVGAVVDEEKHRGTLQLSMGTQSSNAASLDDLTAAAREELEALTNDIVDDEVRVETDIAVGTPADSVVDLARKHDVDHVYVVGRERSPTGKALFGDLAQKTVLNFEGPVTVLTESS